MHTHTYTHTHIHTHHAHPPHPHQHSDTHTWVKSLAYFVSASYLPSGSWSSTLLLPRTCLMACKPHAKITLIWSVSGRTCLKVYVFQGWIPQIVTAIVNTPLNLPPSWTYHHCELTATVNLPPSWTYRHHELTAIVNTPLNLINRRFWESDTHAPHKAHRHFAAFWTAYPSAIWRTLQALIGAYFSSTFQTAGRRDTKHHRPVLCEQPGTGIRERAHTDTQLHAFLSS